MDALGVAYELCDKRSSEYYAVLDECEALERIIEGLENADKFSGLVSRSIACDLEDLLGLALNEYASRSQDLDCAEARWAEAQQLRDSLEKSGL